MDSILIYNAVRFFNIHFVTKSFINLQKQKALNRNAHMLVNSASSQVA